MLKLLSHPSAVQVAPPSTPWYSNTTLLSITTIVIGFLTVLAAVWGSLYVARPRRGLVYEASHSSVSADELADLPEADRLTAVAVSFRLRGSGRLDVPTAAFDSGIPLTIRFADATLHRLMGPCSSQPPNRTVPSALIRDGELVIGPGLIGRDQLLAYRLLVTAHELSSFWRPLPQVRGALIDTSLRKNTLRTKVNILAAVLIIALVIAAIIFLHPSQTSNKPSIGDLLVTSVSGGAAAAVLVSSFKAWIQTRRH